MRQPFVQSKRGERERTRRGIKNVSSLAKRAKEGFVLVHTWPLFIAFSAEKRKNSLSSRFSVALTDIYLSHQHRVVSIFPLLTRARTQTKAGASEKKTRANAVSIHGKLLLSREIALAHAASRSRFPLTLKNKIKHTPTPHHREKSLHELTFCLSVKEKNENAKSKSSLEIHPQKPTRDA